MSDEDLRFMQRALEVARRGAGLVSPNPMVGALVVSRGRVVGEGAHRYDLIKHAELLALEMAGELASGSTIYCTLEPCSHYGRTPPCADALAQAGVERIVIAMNDPNPRVSGGGIEKLRDAGIQVEVGLCEYEARRLNEIYIKFITTNVPFVHLLVLSAEAGAIKGWKPSREFGLMASQYDSLVLGDHLEVNQALCEMFLERERYRPLEVANAAWHSPAPASLFEAQSRGRADLLDCASDIDSILRYLAESHRTSTLVLPLHHYNRVISDFATVDKLTIIAPEKLAESSLIDKLDFTGRVVGLEETERRRAGSFIEVTGYPRLKREA
jgi:pyrimidine deaminase RibD-like protein